jgi:hypothetical protein
MENKIDIKKEWEAPSIKTLSITMTFGGSGNDEYGHGGPEEY